jgi:hypothetical protein
MPELDLLLPNGTRVKVLKHGFEGEFGTVAGYLYPEQKYLILLRDYSTVMLKPSEIEKT